MALAAVVIGERAGRERVVAAAVGIVGVALLVLRSPGHLDTLGLVGAFGSVVASALGFVLVKRWTPPVDMLTLVSWQLVVGGLALLPVALVVEGAPPRLGAENVAGFLWLMVAGTGVAYWCWFTGLRAMPAGAVSLIGLLNPVVGTVLGVLVAGEAFGWPQALGMTLVLGGVLAGQPGSLAWVRRRVAVLRRSPSADADPDLVGGQVRVGVDHPEPVHAGRAGLDVGGEGPVADGGRDRVEALP
jgi:probable blue pigment (indigoidine) exporter